MHSPSTRTKTEIAAACGLSVKEITKSLQISKTTVHRWLSHARHQSNLEACRRWRALNPEKAKEATRRWYYADQQNAQAIARRSMSKWRRANPAAAKVKDRKSYEREYSKNPYRFAEKAERRRRSRDRLPLSDIEKMMCANYYRLARELTKQTGVKYEVDHIWPIRKGGPHLPWNLRVITAEENRKKGGKI